MRTIRELIELAQLGEAAEFTNSIQEALSETALDAIAQMVEDPEEDEEEFDIGEDDIEDLPIEDDVDDLDEDQLDERNELNHQKARAFRAGKKEVQANKMNIPDKRYVGRRYDSKETKDKLVQDAKDKKELAKGKANLMHADAAVKGIALGAKKYHMTHAKDAGKAYRLVHPGDKPTGTVYSNADHKKYNGGQGKFLHKHLSKKHAELTRSIDDLHHEIQRSIQSDDLRGRNDEKYGTTFKFKDDGKPGLEPHHLENLKKLHAKLKGIHHAVSSLSEDVIDWDIVLEDYLAVEDEYVEILQELEEGKTYKANADDNYRSHRKQSYLRRRDRRMKSEETEELSLQDDLSDEELQEIVDTITEDHFDLLDDASKEMLLQYIERVSE